MDKFFTVAGCSFLTAKMVSRKNLGEVTPGSSVVNHRGKISRKDCLPWQGAICFWIQPRALHGKTVWAQYRALYFMCLSQVYGILLLLQFQDGMFDRVRSITLLIGELDVRPCSDAFLTTSLPISIETAGFVPSRERTLCLAGETRCKNMQERLALTRKVFL